LPVVRSSPAFGPPEEPLMRVEIKTSGTADMERNRPPPVRNACGTFPRYEPPEVWAPPRESRLFRDRPTDVGDGYHIAPKWPIRWRTSSRFDHPRSPLPYLTDARFRSERSSSSERFDSLVDTEEELLADQKSVSQGISALGTLIRHARPHEGSSKETSLDPTLTCDTRP